MNIFYYDIAVGLPLRQCFTYKSKVAIKKGTRVVVPFGKKSIVGIVVKKISNPNSLKGLKEIISIADNHSCFDNSIFSTILWASEYYHHPIGEVFFSFMPTLLRKKNDKTIYFKWAHFLYKSHIFFIFLFIIIIHLNLKMKNLFLIVLILSAT